MFVSNHTMVAFEPTIDIKQQRKLIDFLCNIKRQYPIKDQLAFVCIGTDRSTGDSFGPLFGTLLRELGFSQVYGTIDSTCDADSVEKIIKQLTESGQVIVAIDACLGTETSVGTFVYTDGPLIPGAGVGRKLPPVGDFSIKAIVNKRGIKSYWQLQHTSLFFVYRMAYTLYTAFQLVWKEGVEHENINS